MVPLLTPQPKVEKSELAVVLGNGETQDTDFFVDVDLRVKHYQFDASLHLLELPDAFDVIVRSDSSFSHLWRQNSTDMEYCSERYTNRLTYQTRTSMKMASGVADSVGPMWTT